MASPLTCLGAATLSVGLLLTSGCGTTVPTSVVSGTGAGGAGGGIAGTENGIGAPMPGPGANVGQPLAPGASALPDTASGVAGTTGTTGSTGAAPGVNGAATSGLAASATGRGFDARHVYIGFNTINNADMFFKAVGAGDVSFGDMKANAEAVLAEINARGGVLGRKVVGVYHDEDVTEAMSNPAANAEATCAAFTQDTKVVAAVINNGFDDTEAFYTCMAEADTPFFTGIDNFIDQKLVDQYRGYLHSSFGPTADVFAPIFIRRLAAIGYFSPWNTAIGGPGSGAVKQGLLFPDTPSGHRIAALFARLVGSQRLSSQTYFYSPTDVSSGAAAINSAVLKFRNDGVTHVMAPQPAINQFMLTAEQQHYRPRYGVQSLMQLTAAAEIVPKEQLVGAVGVGWQPIFDVGRSEGAAAASCLQQMARRGINYSGQPQATQIALIICDAARIISKALNAGGGLSTQALAQGLAKVGPTFQPALTFRSGYSATRADVVGAVRDIGYRTSCSCFTYLAARLWTIS